MAQKTINISVPPARADYIEREVESGHFASTSDFFRTLIREYQTLHGRSYTRPELMQAIRDYGDAIHPYRDGRSSERVLDAIDAFLAQGGRNRRRKPLNLWRKLKLRRRVGYWGPA